jgi:hypothetical protein
MTPILHRTSGGLGGVRRLGRLFAAASWLAITLAAASPVLGFTSKLTCGKPTRNGRLTVSLVMIKDDGSTTYPEVSLDVDSTWTAETKAAFLRAEFWARVALRDTVKALGTTAEIQFKGQNEWQVHSVNVIRDDSKEPDQVALGIPYPDQVALCSMSGAATGRDTQGGAAFVRLTVGQTIVTQPTQPGMPAEVVEQMLIGQLNQAGIAARFATPEDLTGCYESLPHDGRVIWFLAPDTTGFGEEITDLGLGLDIAAALNRSPEVPSAAPGYGRPVGLRLDVAPRLFSRERVRVGYDAGDSQQGRICIDVFDVTGRRVRRLLDGGAAGTGTIFWDGRDEDRGLVPQGVYFVRLLTPRGDAVDRVVRIRD